MAVDYESFVIRYPEFCAIPVKRVQIFINDAEQDVSTIKFDELTRDRIVSALSAHYLALSQQTAGGNSGSIGNVASKTVDKVSVTYATPDANVSKGSNAYYNSTKYGQEYLSLLRRHCVAMVTVVPV